MTYADWSYSQKRSDRINVEAARGRPISPEREDALWRDENTRIRRPARAIADIRRLREGTR